jgi:hypothetical protein
VDFLAPSPSWMDVDASSSGTCVFFLVCVPLCLRCMINCIRLALGIRVCKASFVYSTFCSIDGDVDILGA